MSDVLIYGIPGLSTEFVFSDRADVVGLPAGAILMRSRRPSTSHIACDVDDGDGDQRGTWGVSIKSLQELASAALAQVNAEYTKRMGAIADAYPVHERESWPVQLQEANLLLSYADVVPIPETVKTPWIDQCAHQRGLDRMELAARIVAKDEGYRTVSGFLSGVRQWHEDCIAMLLQDGEDAREALLGYDHLQGWEQSAPV